MKVATILVAISRHAAIHVCLAMFFAFCWFTHCGALLIMEAFHRQFYLMDGRTIRTMALIDLVAANYRLVIAYVLLVFAAVLFLQIRRRPRWSYRLVALALCAPWMLYFWACAFILVGKVIL